MKCKEAGMIKGMVRNDVTEYKNSKNKANLPTKKRVQTMKVQNNFKCPKMNPSSTNNVKDSVIRPTQDPCKCNVTLSTPTKIIDIAQKYSQNSPFVHNEVGSIFITC